MYTELAKTPEELETIPVLPRTLIPAAVTEIPLAPTAVRVLVAAIVPPPVRPFPAVIETLQ